MPLPRILSREAACFRLRLDPGHLAFEGHFPGQPILPGVVQLDWAARLGAEVFGPLGDFCGLRSLKFQGLIEPGSEVELSLDYRPGQGTLSFTYAQDAVRKSVGTFLFTARE